MLPACARPRRPPPRSRFAPAGPPAKGREGSFAFTGIAMLHLLSRFRRPAETKASRAGAAVALYVAGRPVWTPRDYAALAREGFQRNPVVHRSVRLIAEAAAALPLSLIEGGRIVDAHPLVALMRRPNPREGGARFLESVYGHLLVSGNAYLEAVAVDGAPRELYALRPDRMRVVPGQDGWPAAYDYAVGAETVRFVQTGEIPPILHLTLFHPSETTTASRRWKRPRRRLTSITPRARGTRRSS